MNQTLFTEISQLSLRVSNTYKNAKSTVKLLEDITIRSKANSNHTKDKQILREKRNNYSQAIRQRNKKNKSKNQQKQNKGEICPFSKKKGNNRQQNTLIHHRKSAIYLIQDSKYKCKNKLKPSNHIYNDLNKKNQKPKYQQSSNFICFEQQSNNFLPELQSSQALQPIERLSFIPEYVNTYKIFQQVNVTIYPGFDNNNQLMLLDDDSIDKDRKQKALENQLEDCKKYIKMLENNIKDLINRQNTQVHKLFGNQLNKQEQNINMVSYERMIALEQDIFSLRKINNCFELKFHSQQKKIVEQTQSMRKKSAKQIMIWRQKYNKVFNQNIKLKALMQNSISMEISHDQ